MKIAGNHGKTARKKNRKAWDYATIVRKRNSGATLAEINHKIRRFDYDNPKDRNHSLRNALYRLRVNGGYTDAKTGTWVPVRLKYRVKPGTIKAARRAGLRSGRERQ